MKFSDADRGRFRFEATGNTFRHKDGLREKGWRWDAGRKAWLRDGQDLPADDVIEFARDLHGVEVMMIIKETGEMFNLGPADEPLGGAFPWSPEAI